MPVKQMMPPNCRRVMSSPLSASCGVLGSGECPGRQRDGGCLLDLVRAADAAGVRWAFELDDRGPNTRVEMPYWDYCGEPIPGLLIERGDFGAIHTRWDDGRGSYEQPLPPGFVCPHCGADNVQDPNNFHWWCSACGKNAKEAA